MIYNKTLRELNLFTYHFIHIPVGALVITVLECIKLKCFSSPRISNQRFTFGGLGESSLAQPELGELASQGGKSIDNNAALSSAVAQGCVHDLSPYVGLCSATILNGMLAEPLHPFNRARYLGPSL